MTDETKKRKRRRRRAPKQIVSIRMAPDTVERVEGYLDRNLGAGLRSRSQLLELLVHRGLLGLERSEAARNRKGDA